MMILRKSKTRWLLPLFLLLILSLFTKTQCVYACSCFYDDTLTPAERAVANLDSEYNDIVFTGQLVSETTAGDSKLFTFVVDTVFKGDIASEFTVTTYGDSAGCGTDFLSGSTHLVFVGDGGEWSTSLCSGNVVNPSADILTALGSGNAPSADGSTGAAPNPISNVPTVYVILVVALLFLLILFVVRRMSRE